jgi:hypothetical protein
MSEARVITAAAADLTQAAATVVQVAIRIFEGRISNGALAVL